MYLKVCLLLFIEICHVHVNLVLGSFFFCKLPPNRLCDLIYCHIDLHSCSLHADCAGVYSDGDFMVHFAGLDDKRGWTSRILKEIGTT
jgi:hypothetical protein